MLGLKQSELAELRLKYVDYMHNLICCQTIIAMVNRINPYDDRKKKLYRFSIQAS